jgi:hypothetical protein
MNVEGPQQKNEVPKAMVEAERVGDVEVVEEAEPMVEHKWE